MTNSPLPSLCRTGVSLCLLALVALPAAADTERAPPSEEPPIELPVCSGYDERRGWGMLGVTAENAEDRCDPGAAVMAHEVVTGPARSADRVAFSASCCPLPPGALLDDHVYARFSCPDGRVVTGARRAGSIGDGPFDWVFELRCTAVDRSRFTLAPPRDALVVEYGQTSYLQRVLISWLGPHPPVPQTSFGMIPAVLRFGIGRISETHWTRAACVGYPWGSLLTQVGGRGCRDFKFRALVGASRPFRSPETGGPVKGCGGARALTRPGLGCPE